MVPRSGCSVDTTSRLWAAAACQVRRSDACAARGQSGAGRSHRRGAHRDGREHEPDGGAAQSLRYRYRRACCGPKALPLGLRGREVAAPSLSYREPPSTRSVVVYIGGVATLEKAPLSAKSRLPQVGIGTSCPWRVCAGRHNRARGHARCRDLPVSRPGANPSSRAVWSRHPPTSADVRRRRPPMNI